MVSETSCERANRFLDRRFVVPLSDFKVDAGKTDVDVSDLAFFSDCRAM